MLNVLEKMIYLGVSCSIHLVRGWDDMELVLRNTDLQNVKVVVGCRYMYL